MARRSTTPTSALALTAVAGLAALAVALPAAAGAAPPPAATVSAATPTATATAVASQPVPTAQPAQTALAALATVTVKGRAPKTGYTREQFGKAWADVDRNGCDTRNDVLTRDLASRTYVTGTRGCVVYSGTLADAYSGRSISFVRGVRTSSAVQVDHVVALSDAWQKGAQTWDATRRTAFANDPLNLVAADGPLNAAKGDGDAATWLPPAKASRCAYVARQVAVKVRYGLWMTKAEHDASSAVLATCPSEPLPTGGTLLPAPSPKGATATAKPTTTAKPTAKPTSKSTAKPTSKSTSKPTSKSTAKPTAKSTSKSTSKPTSRPTATPTTRSVRYENCDAVRAAGKAPIRQTDPGFRPAFDRDGDGVGCDR